MSMFQKLKRIFTSIFDENDSQQNIVSVQKPDDEYFDIGEWNKPNHLPTEFDDENDIMLVRYKNNFSQVYTVQYNPKKQTMKNHFDDKVDVNRVALYLVISRKDECWSDDSPSHDYKRESVDNNDFLVQLGNDDIYQANFLHTGNRYGYALCFSSSEKRIFSTKKWMKTPKAFEKKTIN